MDAADCRLVAGVDVWLFGVVLLDVRLKPADQRSSSSRPDIRRSVAKLIAGMLWKVACHGGMAAILGGMGAVFGGIVAALNMKDWPATNHHKNMWSKNIFMKM